MDLARYYDTKKSHEDLYMQIKDDDSNDVRLDLVFENINRILVNKRYKGGDKYSIWGNILIYRNRSIIELSNGALDPQYHIYHIKIFDILSNDDNPLFECYMEYDNENIPYDEIEKNICNKYRWHEYINKNTKKVNYYPKLFEFKNIKKVYKIKESEFERKKVELYNLTIKNFIIPNTIDEQEKHAKSLSNEDLKKYGKRASEKPISETITKIYYRNPYYKEFALRNAKGVCQLCEKKTPFDNKDGKPFLESHHIIPLSQGGVDDEKKCNSIVSEFP